MRVFKVCGSRRIHFQLACPSFSSLLGAAFSSSSSTWARRLHSGGWSGGARGAKAESMHGKRAGMMEHRPVCAKDEALQGVGTSQELAVEGRTCRAHRALTEGGVTVLATWAQRAPPTLDSWLLVGPVKVKQQSTSWHGLPVQADASVEGNPRCRPSPRLSSSSLR